MNANRALYWLLLFLLSAIITPKVYGQEICDSRQLSAIQSCATPNETPFNLILPFTNLSNPKFILQDGKFEEFDELGTATLAGTLVNIEDSNIQFSLELNFSQRSVDNSITVNHECLSNIDNSGFYYYKSFNGLILGINDMEGAYISVRNSGNALQLGYGANWLDKTLAFGAGSKCLLKLTGNPKNGFQLARISRGGSNFMGTIALGLTDCNPCALKGGDTDGDGICDEEDCAPDNKDLPASAGTACDDGDANTINDVIQADRCECKGVEKGDITFDCNDNEITATATYGTNGTTVDYTLPTAITTCGSDGLAVVLSEGLESGQTFPIGTTTVIYTATDDCGNEEKCSFNIIVKEGDKGNIDFDCKETDITATAIYGAEGTTVEYRIPTAETTCELNGLDVVLTEGFASGQTFPIGTTTVIYTATDDCGNEEKCSFDIIVKEGDKGNIAFNCNNEDIIATAIYGAEGTTVEYRIPTAETTCELNGLKVVLSDGLESGKTFPIGTTTVVYTATDDCGNEEKCSFDITVKEGDSGNITFDCKEEEITATAVFGTEGTTVEYRIPTAETTCELNGLKVVLSDGLESGKTFPIGTTTVTYIATDDCDNKEECTFKVTVTEADRCDELGGDTDGDGICDEEDCAPNNKDLPTQAGKACDDGDATTINDVIQADGCDCEGVKKGDITFACNDDITATASFGTNGVTVDYTLPTAVTTCALNGLNVVLTEGLASGSTFPIGTTIVTYTATDECDNKEACTFKVTVTEGADPCAGDNSPIVRVEKTDPVCSEDNGTITFYFEDHASRTNIEFSLDGGQTYPLYVADNAGSATFENLAAGDYDLFVRWGNDDCPVDLDKITLNVTTKTPGTTCDDGDEETIDDVIQEDGCDCIGEIDDGGPIIVDPNACTSRTAFNTTLCMGSSEGTLYGGYMLFRDLGYHYSLENGKFVEYKDGTANLTGEWINVQDPEIRFEVDVKLAGRTVSTPPNSPKSHNCLEANEADFYYYLQTAGTILGKGKVDGAKLSVGRAGPAFQFGVGANPTNSELNFGAAGWITLTIVNQPTTGMELELITSARGSNGDININLTGDPFTCVEGRDAISNTCVEDITVDAAAGSNGAVVNWETPTYSSNCIYNSNVDCSDAPNSVSGFEYVGELDGSKYFISTNTATYYEAKSKTIQEGGYLAVICSQAENDFITSKLNADVTWIGFSDEVTEGTFLWSNGHGCDYTNWLGSDPNDGHNTNEYTEADHTVIQHNSGGWLDRNGAAKYKYILEIPCTGAMPTGTAQMTQTEGPASGEVFPVGETTVAYEGVDACGNTVTCNFKVTVKEGAVDANVCTSRTAFNTNRCGDGTFAGIQYGGYLLLKDEGRHYSLSNGQFVEYNDGTASLTGTWTNIEDDQIVFDVDVTLSGRTANTPTDSPKEHNCINPDYSKFYYYLQTAGTLTGRNKVEGAKITIGRAGPAFQFGVGANPTNTEMNFGAAGWITAEIVKQPTTGSTISLEASSVGSNGDININLSGDPTACIEDRGGNTTFSCDGSLLTNPDFESGSENWWWASNISASSDAYFGSKAALANGGAGGVGQSIDAIPGAIYTLSVYAKKNATEDAVIGIKFYDANENELKANHLAITSSTYQSFGLSAKAPSNAVKVIAIGWKNEGPGKAWWDGFCFDKWTPTVADCNSNNSCALMPSYNDYIFSIGEGDHDNFMDYDNADLTFCDNGDGTISIKGSIINGRDAAWAANEVSPCGAKDGWYVDLTLSDMQDWSTFQGAYVVNDNCKDAYLGLDYWDVKGALKGIGCNTGRTLDVSGPAEGNGGYRMQIGQGGNSHNCDYGLSTWFEATENGNKVVMDIYAGIDAACYESMRPAVVDGPCAGDNAPQVTVNKTNPDCGQDNGKITFSFADHSTRTNIEFSLDGGQTYPLNVKDQAETAVFENLAAGQYDIYVRWGNDECPVNLGVVSLAGDNKAPGTACDDRNDATVNDVIQSDGCTCAGEVDDNGPLFENPCGTSNKAIETYIVGVKGQSNPCFDIPNPENVTKVTVELWVAGNTPPSTVEFTTAGGTTGARTAKPSGIQVLQAVGSGENEFLFRNTFDGNFSKVCTKYSGGRSMAIYVERDIEGAGSSIYVIDRELHSKNNIADCITLDAALPQSGGMRDIHFDIPVHEKGDTDRPVTVKIDIKDSNNNILDTKSQIFTEQNAGNEASLFSIEFQDVSDQAVNATITICSPTNNGESFGLGLITFTTNCTESGGSNDGECDDLLVNPSFEQSGLSPWSFNSNTSYNKSSRYRADGDYMVWIYKKYSHLKDAEIYQDATAIPGAKYSFTFYSGTHKPEFNHEVAIEFYNSYGAQLARKAVQIDFDVDGGDYLQEYFLEETAPTGTTKIRFVGTADGDYLKLDAICVQVDKTNAQVSGRAAPGVSGGTQEIGEVSFFELDEITLGSTVKREGIQLDWYSKNSSLPSKYVIEKSVDGKRFTRIQEITEIVDEHLTIIDDTPDYGTNSYRVIQEFENGQAVVSNIREEKYLLDPASITLYPNPVVHDLNLKIGHFSDLEGTIRIFSTMGQQVYEKTLDAQDKHLKINVSDLKNGMYFLIIEAKNRKPIERQFIVESLK